MDLSALTTEIQGIVQDNSFEEADIHALINEAVFRVAQGVQVPGELHITGPLPELYKTRWIWVYQTARSIDLPADYQRGLFNVYSSTGIGHVPMLRSFQKFISRYPVLETGDSLDACVVHGKTLFYHPAAIKTITFSYYKEPDLLEDEEDSPDCIPGHLQRRLIVGYVCREIFNQIEDGIEGQKVNTNHYDGDFFEGVIELDRYLGDDGMPMFVNDDTDYIL